MSIIFRYAHMPRVDGFLHKAPLIPIQVRNKHGRFVNITGLVDSGADCSVVPADMAEVLGLSLGEETFSTSGIGGDVKVKNSKIVVQVKSQREHYHLVIPVLVMVEDEDIPFLLGRNGFFEEFRITFKQNEEKIILKKIDPDKKSSL